MKYTKIPAKPISYGSKRDKSNIYYIVIHYTGNAGDTAKGNGLFFKHGNTRSAGAHWFVDKAGNIVRSIPMNRTAWSVGGFFTKEHDAAMYYRRCMNANSVSIELCDLTGDPSKKQIEATEELVKYIRKYCPNAKTIIRHWDVNGKNCPAPMAGKKNARWKSFLSAIN